jgi:hypothetical protein
VTEIAATWCHVVPRRIAPEYIRGRLRAALYANIYEIRPPERQTSDYPAALRGMTDVHAGAIDFEGHSQSRGKLPQGLYPRAVRAGLKACNGSLARAKTCRQLCLAEAGSQTRSNDRVTEVSLSLAVFPRPPELRIARFASFHVAV